MATIGYLEGTDPIVLTRLAARGIGTLPLSNGTDNHGKFVAAIRPRDEIDVVVGYLHKILRTKHQGFYAKDLVQSCAQCAIPVLIVVPEADQLVAQTALGEAAALVTLVDGELLYAEIVRILGLSQNNESRVS